MDVAPEEMGMQGWGLLYIPNKCLEESMAGKCNLEVVLHGCGANAHLQSLDIMGWTGVAYNNNAIALFPQLPFVVGNTMICWDTHDTVFADPQGTSSGIDKLGTKNSKQIKAIIGAVNRLKEPMNKDLYNYSDAPRWEASLYKTVTYVLSLATAMAILN
jgi:hypothetical protein